MASNKPYKPYGQRSNGGNHGDVFTSQEVVKFMLDLVGYTPNKDLSRFTILEPSCGDGQFIVEIAKRLRESARLYHFDANKVFNQQVYGYDIDPEKIAQCKERLESIDFHTIGSNIAVANFLICEVPSVDIVVGNPPYVRYENIPHNDRMFYKQCFKTFHYRPDLYVLFFEKTLKLLKPQGKHCFICANRWMKNEYGKKLRSLIAQNYRLDTIINMERANVFQENVLAYPAITLIENQLPETSFRYSEIENTSSISNLSFERRDHPKQDDWTSVFSKAVTNESFCTIEQLGYKIGIGVATGADKIFISSDLPKYVEPELLLPAINARNLSGDRLQWNGDYPLNPFSPNGELIRLSDYPMAYKYLVSHREELEKRHIAKKNRAHWYKTIDRIHPNLKSMAKILLPDISGNSYIFVDEGNYYPLHNIYYITGQDVTRLKLLSAFLMSKMIRRQLQEITNNMNGGFPRWQSQYLRKLRIPDVRIISDDVIEQLVLCYDNRDYESINRIVESLLLSSRQSQEKQPPRYSELTIDFDMAGESFA